MSYGVAVFVIVRLLQIVSSFIRKRGSSFITKHLKILLQNTAAFLLQDKPILLEKPILLMAGIT